MLLPQQIIENLRFFFFPGIEWSAKYQTYLYDRRVPQSYNNEYFHKKSELIILSINEQLQIGTNNKEFINEILSMIWDSFTWFEDYQNYKIESIDKYLPNISNYRSSDKIDFVEDRFSMEDVVNKTQKFYKILNDEGNDYAIHMENMRSNTNNFDSKRKFEKAKLLYVLYCRRKSIDIFCQYINALSDGIDYIDFEKFDYTEYLFSNGFSSKIASADTIITVDKGNFKMSKVDIANLFYILKDEKILIFDKSERKNGAKMNKMIERNFTYQDNEDHKINILNINKEFSKIQYANQEQHIIFLDKFIKQLEERRKRISK